MQKNSREGYEGSKCVFCLQYEVNSMNIITLIQDGRFLHVPCKYQTAFPPSYKSYSMKMNMCMHKVKESIMRIMCRSSESIGHDFIKDTTWFSFPHEFWPLIKFLCRDSVPTHGPFKSQIKSLKMRSGVSLCATQTENKVEIMCFETIAHFYCFDSAFGSFSRYGTIEVKPKVGDSTVMRPHHTIATMRDGILNSEVMEK